MPHSQIRRIAMVALHSGPSGAAVHEIILVATDGSESAMPAIEEGFRLAERCAAKLIILAVVELYPETEYEAFAPTLLDTIQAGHEKHLAALKDRAKREKIQCETKVVTMGEPYLAIVEEAEEQHADLIVMGSHGRTGLKRLLMGSVTSRVIGHAPCKVLVVPSH